MQCMRPGLESRLWHVCNGMFFLFNWRIDMTFVKSVNKHNYFPGRHWKNWLLTERRAKVKKISSWFVGENVIAATKKVNLTKHQRISLVKYKDLTCKQMTNLITFLLFCTRTKIQWTLCLLRKCLRKNCKM